MNGVTEPVVLAIDDDRCILETYELWLGSDFDVRTARGGVSGLEQCDESVDVVLLDRMMPDLSGDEVLDRLEGLPGNQRVVMITALDPDFDIVDMSFDAYVTKPVTEQSLRSTIETVLERERYSEQLRTYYSLVERRATLRAAKDDQTLDESERYQALLDRIERLEGLLGDLVADIDHDDFVMLAGEVS